MHDTKVLELAAENLVAHRLQRADILVTKPQFDQHGADLLGMTTVKDNSRFIRIQCKGRTLRKKRSTCHIDIPDTYISNAFVVFLFIEDGDQGNTHLYCFIGDDIKRTPWTRHDSSGKLIWRLQLSKDHFGDVLQCFRTTDERIKLVYDAIQKSNASHESEIMNRRKQAALELSKAIESILNFANSHFCINPESDAYSTFAALNASFKASRDILGLRVPPPRSRPRVFDCEIDTNISDRHINIAASSD